MSLRSKIVALFLGLAIAPLLIVAGFGYRQATKSAREVVLQTLRASAQQRATDLQKAIDAVERAVEELSTSDATRRLVETPGEEGSRLDAGAWEEEVRSGLGAFAYASLQATGRGQVALVGSRPEQDWRCTAEGGARLQTLRRVVEIGDRDVQVEVGVWLDDLPLQRPLSTAESVIVFPRGEEEVLLSSSCEDFESGAPPRLVAARGRSGDLQFPGRDGERLASFATLPDRAWSVTTHTRIDSFLAPMHRIRTSYWVFILTLTLATVLAFSILLDRVVTSLEDLTAAAARIGEGELNPWLPPPGEDEVGRLSLAFSSMLARVRHMMQRVDYSGRLAVVGQLTSYLAHEIRNPLSSIRMNLQSLQRDVRRGHLPAESEEAIEISLREVDRLTSSLTSVLQLGRPTREARETVSVHEVAEDAAGLLAREFRRSGVELELELDSAADRVRAAPGPLKGVFLNLLMNALEAQQHGGKVEVRSRLVSSPGVGPTVAVRVRDYGGGVPPELRNRIFEPFFTTRSHGSGIGLAMALRTIREHGGDLFLGDLPESESGAEFVVELPLAAVVAETVTDPEVDLPDWMGAGPALDHPRDAWDTTSVSSRRNGSSRDETDPPGTRRESSRTVTGT